jgi:chemotaxis signal transduction protein/nucleoid-associated protein YgaU
MQAARDAGGLAWLVFRLGPHVLCASALDVEGIIERVRPRPVPFSPPYMLGWFDFRGRVAAVISLRRKFGIQAGEDSATGPYVVARVQGELAAFWVDEVRDVLESHQASWQPMPEMPGAAAFDSYTIQDGEVILRTSFEQLLRADTVADFAAAPGPAAAAPEPQTILEPAAPDPVARSAIAEPAPAMADPAAEIEAPQPAPDRAAPASGSEEPAPKRESAVAPERPPRRAEPPRVSRSQPRQKAPPPVTVRKPREPVAPPPPLQPRKWEAEPHAFPAPEPADWEPALPGGDSVRWGRWVAASAGIAVLVLLAMLAWPLIIPDDEPVPGAAASGPILASAPDVSEPPPPAPASARVVTVKTQDFTMTVDRPAKAPAAAPPPPPTPPLAATSPANPDTSPRRIAHVVVRGDTLGHIAQRYLGDAARYPELARLSRIRDPDLIYPGDLVTIDKVRARP